jgi:hypothetical protein
MNKKRFELTLVEVIVEAAVFGLSRNGDFRPSAVGDLMAPYKI